MYKYKVILCGCTRSSGNYIYNHLLSLVRLGQHFTEYAIIVYENDSTDDTLQQLKKFKAYNHNFYYISETNVANNIIKNKNKNNIITRSRIIAHGRNMLLNEINERFNEYDLMIMTDLDNVLNNFDTSCIDDVFKYDINSWDGLTANCLNRYYDIWALRISLNIWDPLIHEPVWTKEMKEKMNYDWWDCWNNNSHVGNKIAHIKRCQALIPRNYPLIESDSSFGGMGIYKISKIKNCRYGSERYINGNAVEEQCEHVSFHMGIKKNGGKILICPSLIVNCAVGYFH